MGSEFNLDLSYTDIIMKVFIALSALLAVALANQSSHQVIKHGNAPSVSHAVHRPHGSYHSIVASQPHAAPQDVHNPYAKEKYGAAVHAPAHAPVHAPVYGHHAPVHHAAPYHPAPVYHKPAPYHAPIVHTAPAYHKPAPYHPEPAYDGPAVYQYGYAVADNYSGANFAANENRDGYATNGEYRVNLPDGRTQIVTYSVNDAYGGYVADVKYEGVAQYPEYKPAPYHPAKVAPYHA